MAFVKKQYNWNPDRFAYQLSETFEVYHFETADVFDQLLKHMLALSFLAVGGPGTLWAAILKKAYGLDLFLDGSYDLVRDRLIQDCDLLNKAAVAMMEIGGRDGEAERKAIVTALRSQVPWLDVPSEPAIQAPATVASA